LMRAGGPCGFLSMPVSVELILIEVIQVIE